MTYASSTVDFNFAKYLPLKELYSRLTIDEEKGKDIYKI